MVFVEAEEPVNTMLLKNALALCRRLLVPDLFFVRHSDPLLWKSQAQSHFSLKIGLVEARENSKAVICLELRVKVLLLILLVNE